MYKGEMIVILIDMNAKDKNGYRKAESQSCWVLEGNMEIEDPC